MKMVVARARFKQFRAGAGISNDEVGFPYILETDSEPQQLSGTILSASFNDCAIAGGKACRLELDAARQQGFIDDEVWHCRGNRERHDSQKGA